MSDTKVQPLEHAFTEVPFDLDELLNEVSSIHALEGTPLRAMRNRIAAALQELRRARSELKSRGSPRSTSGARSSRRSSRP